MGTISRNELKIAVVGGPMYDHLYACLPAFERESGYRVTIGAKLIHPELNDHLEARHRDRGLDYDLVSTHSKYAPAQREFLLPLDDYFAASELEQFIPATVELARYQGQLLGIPRNIDVRLLYYRRDLFEDEAERRAFRACFGRELAPPATWDELVEVACHFTRPPALHGFAFPGKQSGLFGGFFELVAMMGGRLFEDDLSPAFLDASGERALGLLRALHLVHQVTPPGMAEWQFDEVAESFRAGRTAMVADWPGGFGAMRDPARSRVADRLDLALYPVGSTGKRWVYAGGFTFAIPTSVRDIDGALALLRFLTSTESQRLEARNGAIPTRIDVTAELKASAASGSLEARRLAYLERTVAHDMLIPPKFARYPAFEEALWPALQAGFTGRVSVRAALEQAARETDRAIHG